MCININEIESGRYIPDFIITEETRTATLGDTSVLWQNLYTVVDHSQRNGNNLLIQGQNSNHRWDCHERKNNYTNSTIGRSPKTATHQSYGHRKNKNTRMQVNLLGKYEHCYRQGNQGICCIFSGNMTQR